MALDLWFREDVTRILASTYDAMQSSTRAASYESSKESDLYRQGFSDALRAVAVAFGVFTPNPRSRAGSIEFAPREPSGRQPPSNTPDLPHGPANRSGST
jgi:hypothetical protein